MIRAYDSTRWVCDECGHEQPTYFRLNKYVAPAHSLTLTYQGYDHKKINHFCNDQCLNAFLVKRMTEKSFGDSEPNDNDDVPF